LGKDLTHVVTESTEDGTEKKTGTKNGKPVKKFSISIEGALIAILFLGFWGICASILLLLAMYS
tara:strand:- start:1166 stop:1357 length:192 start_codon:yes stop_codon:yes gene_type:complete